jgi:thiosulfate/3-mercaptopyruvate sulfurtransferase
LTGRDVHGRNGDSNAEEAMSEIGQRRYFNPDVLVSTEWVASHLDAPKVRIVESNEDPLLYASRHVPNAVEVDWVRDLNQPVRRDYLEKEAFEQLMRRVGVTPDTTVVLYGDKNNWWATYALWIFQLFGHKNAKIMDGGRLKWEKESREMTRDVPKLPPSDYRAPARDDTRIRAFRDQVLEHIRAGRRLIDVRSPEEYRGERLHMPDYPNEGALRGGHIPGAASIPWASAINPEDGTFKGADQLREIYETKNHFKRDDDVIVYCRIGERSSHTWFVLTYLLGYNKVRNYDGSWTEWGNLVNVPIQKP